MKKHLLFLVLIYVCLISGISAQNSYSYSNTESIGLSLPSFEYNNDPDDYPRKYYAFTVGFGARYLNTQKSNLLINSYDPNTNELKKSQNSIIEGKYPQLGYYFAVSKGKYTKLTHKIFFEFTDDTHKSGGVGYSITWNFPFQHEEKFLVVRAGLYGMIGNILYKGTSVENPKDTIITMSSDFTTIGTEIETSYFIVRSFSVFINFSYDLLSNMSSNQKLGIGDFGEYRREVISNGSPLKEMPMKYGKIRFSLGGNYIFNRT